MKTGKIEAKGVRVNNLKGVDLTLPLNRLYVMTGVSGSGKSSLAFDTLYAEGQRRYVESLSAYARQFLGRMPKPECDYIKGLPPAIAIEQKVNTRNPRSTVGTSTEISDYMRMLFSRVGKTISPVSGREVRKHNVADVVKVGTSMPEGTRIAILSPIKVPEGRTFGEQIKIYLQEGYSRLECDGEFKEIAEILSGSEKDIKLYEGGNLLIDRVRSSLDSEVVSRMTDSVETAWYEGHNECILKAWTDDGIKSYKFSNLFEADGLTFREPNDLMFNFNNPYGACRVCEGFGKIMGISEDLVVPDVSRSFYEDAVQCFRGEKMGEWKSELIRMASSIGFPIHKPYKDLTREEHDILWHGKGSWQGIDGFFRWVDENQYKIQYRVLKARYRGKTLCPECHGSRLRPDVEYVKVGGKSITELSEMSLTELKYFFDNLELEGVYARIGQRVMKEIRSRLHFMIDVGLGYLTLSRPSNTLSGGESQRINLATSLGSALVGSLYILDEPSIGLHSRDTERLINVLKHLRDIGNTVIVVEHDEDIMLAADEIVDIGPDAGIHGGEIVYQGNLKDSINNGEKTRGYTLDYLNGRREIKYDPMRRPWKKYIEVKGACANNLKNLDVRFPLGVMTVVTGVSGSGKSTLVRDILYRAVKRGLGDVCDAPGSFRELSGDINSISAVEFIDQNPIGASSRSNPATYLKAFDEIRQLFARQPLSQQMGFTPAYFSFNAEGGRCEECKGEGTVTIPMQFMADITIPCEECHGKRFKEEVLDVKYRGKSIYDFLEMSVIECVKFLKEHEGTDERRIIRRLQPLLDVGLGYIKLGQSSSTLSGGENQRVKLAYYLSQEKMQPTLFIFDEPTTGLHFHDISTLMKSLRRLVERGHTVVIIEHNMEVIKCADYVIDIGPEGGKEGGEIVVAGTPEEVAECKKSYTGKYLRMKLKGSNAD
ncbi:MAG: excinuclease ABC subunit UvrA [Prevotella sp.]|nr:excinuclease ABC subunit UvrA [Bacteroides sp.]MCM1365813.1 excinuclease ABC subunit UvrA [Prevotella sp.]MCM1436495.1 excinuclease ABC subunit UvrA [Prevotella sp.]